MLRKFSLMFLAIILSACGLTSQVSPTPMNQIILNLSSTPPSLPESTSTVIPATAKVDPTTDPNYFRDDFIGTLDAGWSWVREDPLNWSLVLVPGSLRINVNGGYVAAHNNNNLLLRTAPQGDFQIDTRLTFKPDNNFQFAGLIIYEDDSNFIQGGHSFCSAVGCVGNALYMNYFRKGLEVTPAVSRYYENLTTISLRLSRKGNNYTFEASTYGTVWFSIGTITSDINPVKIGLVAGQNLGGGLMRSADFDYFEVRSLP